MHVCPKTKCYTFKELHFKSIGTYSIVHTKKDQTLKYLIYSLKWIEVLLLIWGNSFLIEALRIGAVILPISEPGRSCQVWVRCNQERVTVDVDYDDLFIKWLDLDLITMAIMTIINKCGVVAWTIWYFLGISNNIRCYSYFGICYFWDCSPD